jgi:LemA protein
MHDSFLPAWKCCEFKAILRINIYNSISQCKDIFSTFLKPMLYISIALVCLLIFGGIFYYNTLVNKKNRMKEAWSGIDVYLKKRYELIPNLIETVKGYASHEQKLMQDLVRLRNEAIQGRQNQDKINTENHLTEHISKLMLIAENYPDLKANTNFLQLQIQLVTIESEIELSRRYYNGTVREHNIQVQSFPSNVIASLFGFENGLFFEVNNSAERETVKVSF